MPIEALNYTTTNSTLQFSELHLSLMTGIGLILIYHFLTLSILLLVDKDVVSPTPLLLAFVPPELLFLLMSQVSIVVVKKIFYLKQYCHSTHGMYFLHSLHLMRNRKWLQKSMNIGGNQTKFE